jgi:hypothetical protein
MSEVVKTSDISGWACAFAAEGPLDVGDGGMRCAERMGAIGPYL